MARTVEQLTTEILGRQQMQTIALAIELERVQEENAALKAALEAMKRPQEPSA